ncbi:MAG: NupC/NupG family nucleoside CNT transporter [Planctomycetota bacterium]|jgi:CNT family concentrative nucleoside transporter
MERVAALIGIAAMLGGCWFFSAARSKIRWRIVVVGIALQVFLALFLVRPDAVPWLLTLACGASLGFLVRPGREDTPTVIARSLGMLGFLTTVLALGFAGRSLGVWALVAVPATVVYVLPFIRRDLAARIQSTAALVGCVAPAVLIWTDVLPNQFLFLALSGVGDVVKFFIERAEDGAKWVFGSLGDVKKEWIFAIQVSAIVIFFSALMSVLYYLRFLPWLVGVMARLLYRTLGVSGAEALSAAANVFIGQTEAPLVIRPYLDKMTRSEIMALMAGGFATIAGSVFGIYVQFLDNAGFKGGAANLIAASVMSAPAAFVFAKLLLPETEESQTSEGADLPQERLGVNLLDALAGGVTAGVRLAVNIAAMLLVFYALIAVLNLAVGWCSTEYHALLGDPGSKPLTFQQLYGYLFAPLAFLIGVPWDDCVSVGQLLGTKTIFNEFIAYEELGGMIETGLISKRSAMLSTYALCGFANFMSIGIQIGGLSALAPSRRSDFASLALKAMIAGALACQLTACIVGLLA